MNVLYQQLLTSFTKQNISDVASSSASKISHPSQLNATTPQLTNMVNIRRSKLPKRGDSRSVIQEDDIDRCREPQTGFRSESRLFYFIDSNGIVKEPTISLSDSQQARLAQFIQDSEKRQQRIREVSRRRAVFAAHRRAAACNLMRGTVDLENVDELLTTDLTKIEAFPSKQMAKDTISLLKMGRILWVVRHAEREDNINRRWREKSSLRSDNSPLSKRGCVQAQELAKRFQNVQLDHVFTSPFDRTLDTVSRLVGERDVALNVEPGLCEALYLCERPPGFEPIEKIKTKYPLVDDAYQPVVGPIMPKEGYGDDACVPRLRTTLNGIFDKCKTGCARAGIFFMLTTVALQVLFF
ncbi:hypothetical protein QR680_001734 [Steinernema hermaphroditum]|uniref:Uncharacterized protein n=1 Tax=Steinernema hermaphroditum TaxID=289476 RepID=A0AA39LGL3_9BILA|nr:hypothetical protein QR680_001734 [Steinernema hermaphroditum]